jgi:hypothetical protein
MGARWREYKAYTIGPDDLVQSRVDLICADDEAAKEYARRLADGCAVELWRDEELLARFERLQ